MAPELNLDVGKIAVYSDDIAFLIKLDSHNDMDMLLSRISRHFQRFGMTLKIRQTMVSKTRITMLRQHYIGGIRADAAPKRMLSATHFSCSTMDAQEVELTGLSSACNSAIELANSIVPATVLKWYRASLYKLRSFISSLDTPIDEKFLRLGFRESTISLYKSHFKEFTVIPSWFIEHINELKRQRKLNQAFEMLMQNQGHHKMRPSEKPVQFKADICNAIIYDQAIWVLFHCSMILPTSVGGSGLLSLEQSALTGFGEGFSRPLAALSMSFRSTRFEPLVAKIFENLLGSRLQIHGPEASGLLRQGRGGPGRQYGYAPLETDLITEEWPSHGYPPGCHI